jgi:hypothetical protein
MLNRDYINKNKKTTRLALLHNASANRSPTHLRQFFGGKYSMLLFCGVE